MVSYEDLSIKPRIRVSCVYMFFVSKGGLIDFAAFCISIGIKHVFSCINIRQVPWEMLKTEAGGRGFQHLPRDLANVNALKNHVRSLLLRKNLKHLLHIALFLLHYFVSPFHRCRANAISTEYARSGAGQYTSRDGSNFVARVNCLVNTRLFSG